MRTTVCVYALLMCICSVYAQHGTEQELTVVPGVDLQKYSGTWFEIARLPNRFQEMCEGDVTATYIIDGEELVVVNRCRKENGEMTEAKGRARRASSGEPNTKLKVRFAPAFLSFLPFVWGDYWIIDLAPDYSHAVIGEPDRQYLWILARTRHLDDTTMRGIMERIRQQGYDVKNLILTKQTQ